MVGALHERATASGVERSLVVADSRSGLTIVDSRTFGPGHDADLLAALAGHGVSRLIRIFPARETICRTADIPAGLQPEMDGAAGLLAEASLPEGLPAHRRAGGLLPDVRGGGQRAVLLTAWRAGDEPDQVGWLDQSWVAPITALAFLAGGIAPAAYAPAAENAICIVAPGPERTAARVLVTSPSADRLSELRLALDETRSAVNAVEFPTVLEGREIVLSESSVAALATAVRGTTLTAEWIDRYGLALGALLTYTSTSASARSLASLHPDAPEALTPWPERTAAWLAHPKHAIAVGAVSLALLVAAPLGFAGARLAVLNAKTAGMPEQERSAADVQKRAALYRELVKTRWPMTKLLADIAASTPEGVDAEAVRLAPDQGFSMQGTAESQDLLATLQKNLNDTGLFEKLRVIRAEASSSGVSFDITGDVVSPTNAAKRADDFAAKTLAVRLYGDAAAGNYTPESGASGTSDDSTRSESSRGGDRPRPLRSDRASREEAAKPKPVDIPPELTDAQIAAMDRSTAMKEWSLRKNVAGKPGVDPGVKSRLDGEIPKLFDRMKAAGGGN